MALFFFFLFYSVVTGLPTTTKPPASQKWVKNKQAGGGAYIPCEWVLLVMDGFVDETITKITTGLKCVEEGEEMEVQVCWQILVNM